MTRLAELVALVTEFEKLDGSIQDVIDTHDMDMGQLLDIVKETLEAKQQVKRHLADCKPLNVQRELGIKLKKIRDDSGYTIDFVVDALATIGIESSQEPEEGLDFIDALFTEGTADYVDDNFFRRKNQIGTLIVSQSLPNHFDQHFVRLRECYALGIFEAAVVYCRAVIETGCYEALRRRKLLPDDAVGRSVSATCLRDLMQKVKNNHLISRHHWERADAVIKKANNVLHAKQEQSIMTEQEVFSFIQDTFALIEDLFSDSHKRKSQ